MLSCHQAPHDAMLRVRCLVLWLCLRVRLLYTKTRARTSAAGMYPFFRRRSTHTHESWITLPGAVVVVHSREPRVRCFPSSENKPQNNCGGLICGCDAARGVQPHSAHETRHTRIYSLNYIHSSSRFTTGPPKQHIKQIDIVLSTCVVCVRLVTVRLVWRQ